MRPSQPCRRLSATGPAAALSPTLLAAGILLALASASVAPAADPKPIRPEGTQSLRPWNVNLDQAIDVKAIREFAAPHHYLFDSATVEEIKRRVRERPGMPAGRLLRDSQLATAGPDQAIVTKAPDVDVRFTGLNIITAGHDGALFLPPDTIVAAGTSSVLEASNVALRLSDREGGNSVTRSLNNFFGVAFPPVLFDPRVYFDRLSRRYFVAAVSVTDSPRTSFLYLAVARRRNPKTLTAGSDWCTYRIKSKRGSSWADYPTMGMNEDWLALSVNNFKFNGRFRAVFVHAIDKDELVDNSAGCPTVDATRFALHADDDDVSSFTVVPAQHYSTTSISGTPLFLVSSKVVLGASSRYALWRLEDAGDGTPEMSVSSMSVAELYDWPPNALHRGSVELDTGDSRVMQAAFRDGSLWAVHATSCDFGTGLNESCLRAVEILPSGTGASVTSFETLGGGEDWYFWMPGVAVNAAGEVVMPFQRSHPQRHLEFAVVGRPAGSSEFDSDARVLKGRCGLEDLDSSGRNRTGDYVGAQTDPADDHGFWIAGETSARLAVGCAWKTTVARVSY